MEIKEAAVKIAKELSDRKGRDIVVIDIGEKSSFADYMINVTASSERQLGALGDSAEDAAVKLELTVKGIEGRGGSGWMLLDLGDIIINVFTGETREKYSIDKIWSDCPSVEIE
ncbi:MAG: ribosome silencing factor [Mobilibacterium timonense]|uniref:ribosome silencing factor n=1 Tax=Mobilibacterium timonense TaxID=1871012 RepID=UPI0023520408|nr:ribosome silencing factor [Mobilibacterium timonense]MBM6991058.1 ribosome silencing factor [Mobilibacterium timonense]